MAERRYFWLKLKEDFFEEKYIRALRRLPDGDALVIVYLKLQLKSLKTEGIIKYDHIMPSVADELALLLDEDVNKVKLALQAIVSMGMAELWDDETLYLSAMQSLVGSETSAAARMRRHREQKALHCYADVTKRYVEKEKSREDTEIDMEKSNKADKPSKPPRHKYGHYSNVLLSDEDMDKLKSEFSDWEQRIERLSEYMASTGKSYKNHLATIRNWARRDTEKKPSIDTDYGDPLDFYK